MANPAPPAINPPPNPPVLYRDFFSDAANDPFNGNYTDCLAPYAVPAVGALAANVVRTLATTCRSQNVPTAYILQHDNDLALHIYVQLDKFHFRMGLPATPWDDGLFIGKGELHHNQQIMVEFRNDYFNQTNQVLVPTAAVIDNALAADADATSVGPYNNEDAGTEPLRVRRTCYVPPAYVPLFLAGPTSPRAAWETVRAQIVTNNKVAACQPLIDFLRVALTRVNDQNHATGITLPPPIAPLADALLLDRRRKLLEVDFPSLNRNLIQIQQHQIAGQLGLLVTETRASRHDEAARRALATHKPPDQYLGPVGTIRLLRYCNQQNPATFPPFWSQISRSPKNQHLSLLQWELNRVKALVQEPDLQFVATASLLETVKSLHWEMNSNDSVQTGLNLFLLAEEVMDEALGQQAVYELLHSNGAAPSLSDAAMLIKAKAGAPRMIFQARQQACRMEILLKVIIGETHPLATELGAYCNRMMSNESRLHLLQADHLLLPTMLCKKIAVTTSNWFKNQAASPAPIPIPNFCKVFEDIDNESPWQPVMSPIFLAALNLTAFRHRPTPTFTPISNVPMVPPVTPPTGNNGTGAAPPTNADPNGARINNLHFNATLFSNYKAAPTTCRKIRHKIQAGEVPALPLSKMDNQSICLAWHTKGLCNDNCGRKVDHVEYSETEYAPLAQWCTTNFPTV